MELNVYTSALAVCSVITLLLTIKARRGSGSTAPLSAAFKRFQFVFLAGAHARAAKDILALWRAFALKRR